MPRDADSPVVFFIDRALGARQVADALAAAGERVEIHDAHFAPDTLDVEWIPHVGAKGWFVLTKDKALKDRVPELLAIRAASLGVFALARGNITGAQMGAAFVAAREHMKALARRSARSFVVLVIQNNGRLSATKRKARFPMLTDDEVAAMEAAVRETAPS